MGTRNLTIVQLDGEYKVAQYCQWDGYPSAQGSTVLEFLRLTKGNHELYKDKLRKVRFLTKEEYAEITNVNGWSDIRKELARDMGAKVLWHIATEGITELYNSIDFAQDSLMCEWAYVIDFDTNQLEVYKGFNTESLTEGRFTGEAVQPYPDADRKYAPIKLLKSYSLDDLPTLEQFILDCDPPREDCTCCNGNGSIKVDVINRAKLVVSTKEEECPQCKGEGQVAKVQA